MTAKAKDFKRKQLGSNAEYGVVASSAGKGHNQKASRYN